MEIYIDTANIDEIRTAVSWGVVRGATTNPKIMSMERPGYSFEKRIGEIIELVGGPVSVEVTAEDVEGMVVQAKEFAGWHQDVVIKIPMSREGLQAVTILERIENVRTNVTAIMASNQAVLAALAGAAYVSLFYGRIGDMGYDAAAVISETADLFRRSDIPSKIIAGSVRQLGDVNRAFQAGADIVTIPFKILDQMTHNPRTSETIAEFNEIWREMKEKKLIA